MTSVGPRFWTPFEGAGETDPNLKIELTGSDELGTALVTALAGANFEASPAF